MKRVRVKAVDNPKYAPGTIYLLVSSDAVYNNQYRLVYILDAIKVKRVRYLALILDWYSTYVGWHTSVYDLTEAKLEQYYLEIRGTSYKVESTEQNLKFVVKFGTTPIGVVKDTIQSAAFKRRIAREVATAQTRLEKAEHKQEAIEKLYKSFEEEYGTEEKPQATK